MCRWCRRTLWSIAATSRGEREEAPQAQIRDYYRGNVTQDADLKALFAELAEVRQKRNTLDASLTTTLVMQERTEPRGAYVLERGEYETPRRTGVSANACSTAADGGRCCTESPIPRQMAAFT